MKMKLKIYLPFFLCFAFIFGNAQKEDLSCKKFEEGLYLNSMLNKPLNPQHFIDSISGCMSDSPKLHLTVGKYYFNTNNYTAAEKEYLRITANANAEQKQVSEAYYYLGLITMYTSRQDQSIEYSKKAMEGGYYQVWGNENIGLAYLRKGMQPEAISYFEKCLKVNPNYASAVNNIGLSNERLKKPAIALKYYYKADSMAKGKDPVYASNIFRSLRQLDRNEEASRHIKAVYPAMKDNRLITVDYCKALFDEKRYDEVLQNARRLYKMHPSNADEWFDAAYAYFDGGRIDTAFYAYQITLKYNPKHVSAVSNLVLIYEDLGMYKEANAKLDYGFSLDSSNWYYYERKYYINLWQHNFAEAYKWATLIKNRFPSAKKAIDHDIGWALLNMKEYDKALPEFRTMLAKKPKDDRLLNNIGKCHLGLKQYDSAAFYFRKAMSINPENSYIYHNRAALYAYQGKADLACADLKTAIDKEYNWIIDENLAKVKEANCPGVNTNRKVIIHAYKGNAAQFADKYNFIKLKDSLLNDAVTDQILKDIDTKIVSVERDTKTVFDSFKIFPNPSQGKFNIETSLDNEEPLTIKIFSENGSLVLSDKMQGSQKQVTMHEPAGGLYIVMISDDTGILSVKKIIVAN